MANQIPAESILKNFGGIAPNRLETLIDSYGNDDEIHLIHHSPYYSADLLPSSLKSKSEFKVVCINANGLLSKLDEIRILVNLWQSQNFYFDCFIFQETWLDQTWLSNAANFGLLNIDGYTCYPQGKHCSSKGGLAIYVRSEYKVQYSIPCPKSGIWEGLFLQISSQLNGVNILVGNIYKPPKNNNNNTNIAKFIEELTPILNQVENINSDIIIGGDFNINLLKLNERLKFSEYFDLFISHSFFPKITLPTRIGSNSCTLIDNIYCRFSSPSRESYAGIIYSGVSDHFPCFVSIKCSVKKSVKPPKLAKTLINPEKAMSDFLAELSQTDIYNKLNVNIDSDPDANYEILINSIQEIKQKHFPTRLVKFDRHKHKNNKWITYGIIKSIKYRDEMHLKLKRIPQGTHAYCILKQNLSVYNSILKKSIREAKFSYYHNLFEKYKHDIKKTWQNISSVLNKSTRKKSDISQIMINGTMSNDKIAITESFNSFFANIGPQLAEKIDTTNKATFNSYLTKKIMFTFNFSFVDTNHVLKIIKSLKPKHSCGHDGITLIFLKQMGPTIIKPLTLIINQSLATGIFPNSLKIAKVTPLFKKDDAKIVDNYRPISLLTSISKVFEKVAHIQLSTYFKSNNLFFKSQYGFREEHSTELASLEFIDQIVQDFENKKTPVTIFMDLSKAFDTLNHDILLHKLKYYGVTGLSLQWFKSYLTNRTQYVEIDNVKSTYLYLKTGVPQGSILGPLLFLIYMNDIPQASDYFSFILYADDTTLRSYIKTHTGESITSISNSINNELQNVSDWLAVNMLSLNVKKTKFMVFHPYQKNIENCVPSLKIGNTDIERVKEFNFLGLIIEETLSWKSHVDYISNKISKHTGVLNRLKHFLPPYILRTLYFSLIHSQLNYSLLAWGFNCIRVKKLQKRAVRIVSVSKYNAHTEPLMKSLKILKLEDMFRLNVLKWYFKFQNKQLPLFFNNFTILRHSESHPYNTRNNFVIPHNITRLVSSRYCLRNHVSVVLNTFGQDILDKVHTHSYTGFSNYIKFQILSSYSPTCAIQNCYICRN